MSRRLTFVVMAGLLLLGTSANAAEVPLLTAHGVVEKASKDSITIQPRSATGKFEKSLELKLVGTSKVTLLVPVKKSGKTVYTRRETSARDLKAKQPIAAIFARATGGGYVLLTAVVQPAP
jgi:hypothetical protein